MNKKLSLVFSIFLPAAIAMRASSPAPAVSPAEAAVMTTDQRLAARYAATRADATRIDGRKEPHLLMKWELFDNLLRATCSGNRDFDRANQRAIDRLASEAGFVTNDATSDFWQRLTVAASPYLQARDATRLKAQRAGRPLSFAEARSLCAARFAAMQRLATEFEPGGFERFLYQAIAPITFTDWQGGAEQLRQAEEGCS